MTKEIRGGDLLRRTVAPNAANGIFLFPEIVEPGRRWRCYHTGAGGVEAPCYSQIDSCCIYVYLKI